MPMKQQMWSQSNQGAQAQFCPHLRGSLHAASALKPGSLLWCCCCMASPAPGTAGASPGLDVQWQWDSALTLLRKMGETQALLVESHCGSPGFLF